MRTVRSITKIYDGYKEVARLSRKERKKNALVVPDQSLKVKDVMERFIKTGQPLPELPGTSKPVWTNDERLDAVDMEKLRDSDLNEKMQFAKGFKVNLKKPEPEPEKKTVKEWMQATEKKLTQSQFERYLEVQEARRNELEA